jgi:hypothetical protein
MKFEDIKNLDRDDILGMIGLETKPTNYSRVFSTMGTLAIGLLVGAGVALLLAPKAGSELRNDIRTRIRHNHKADEISEGAEDSVSKTASHHV